MKSIKLLSIVSLSVAALFATSCSQISPALVRTGTAVAVASTLQYGVPKAQKTQVAQNVVAASKLYNTFSGGTVPTVAQFQLELETYLPNNPSKALTENSLVTLYSANYDLFKSKAPQVQLDYLSSFLYGAGDGAAPFLK